MLEQKMRENDDIKKELTQLQIASENNDVIDGKLRDAQSKL